MKFFINRILCILLAALLLCFFLIPLIIALFIASWDTKSSGIFHQSRIGKNGIPFTLYKLRTLQPTTNSISAFGKFLRKYKLDELPQLINILTGDMTFVGPRPDVPGYADELKGEDRIILSVRPGLTGLASLKYRNEEYLLAKQSNPVAYNDTIIWPDKVRINKWYVENRSLWMDLKILFYTVLPVEFDVDAFIEEEREFKN